MGKNKQQIMDLNRETAMRLWNKSFGKETKVQDFAGRTIAKGAYNDRNSDFGWNVDHILPQSKGGVTADHNLVCCHIQTNDEKANRFPCFTSNGIAFEIIKVQNHYEIRQKSKVPKHETNASYEIDFFDSASGVRYFKKLKGMQNKCRFVGSVLICLKDVSNNAVIDFIEELFSDENLSFSEDYRYFINRYQYHTKNIRIIARNFDMPQKEDIRELLDKCVLLNTYLSSYFYKSEYISGYDIYYRIDYYGDKSELYSKSKTIDFHNDGNGSANNSIFINELVRINTDAGKKVESSLNSEYTKYNFIFTNLSKNLIKEVNGK